MSIICAKHYFSLFHRSVDSLNLLQGFWQPDDIARHDDLETLQRTLDSWYYGFGSPAVAGILESVEDDTGGTTMDTSMHWLIREQIADLVRISFTGPSIEIRSFAKDLLMDLKTKKGFRIPHFQVQSPSLMISLPEMSHLDCLKEEPLEGEHLFTTYTLLREHWFQWGRLENYIAVMAFHPEYLECYMKVQAHLFRADLPIPYPDRHYLAILAAAEQRCIYLVLLFARQFLASGGDPSWIRGLNHGPLKWRQLAELNIYLCTTPWKVTADQIYDLTHGGGLQSRETLSLSELMHAVAILTHVHALACFVFGCGICPEIDHLDVVCFANGGSALPTNGVNPVQLRATATKPSGDDARSHGADQADRLVAEQCPCPNCATGTFSTPCPESRPAPKQSLSSSSCDSPVNQLLERIREENRDLGDPDEDTVVENFYELLRMNKKLDSSQSVSTVVNAAQYRSRLNQHPAIARFIHMPDSGYEDFNDQPFHGAEYCWQEEGYGLADRLCTDLGTLLDEKFRNACDLTYNTLNFLTEVDTSLYRRAVWNQIQSFFGICHEDFHYDCINRLLTTEEQLFLKACSTRPDTVDPNVYKFETSFPVLSPSEVVHVILMVVEARQQACLLYALRAISECQAGVHR